MIKKITKQRITQVFSLLTISMTAFVSLASEDKPIDMAFVPAGAFVMGANAVDDDGKAKEFGSIKPWYLDEEPRQEVTLPAFWIDLYEVSNKQFRDFIISENYWVPETWRNNGYLLTRPVLMQADLATLIRLGDKLFRLDMNVYEMSKEELITAIEQQQKGMDDIPVTGITWENARAYCAWKGKRLPSEAEWEKAARGEKGLIFPWGNEWDESKLNAGENEDWPLGFAPVNAYEQGRSPYGVYNMSGNVMEWVADWYGPYDGSNHKTEAFGREYKVVRGGGWGGEGHYAITHFYRAAYRFYLKPTATYVDLGFRCAKNG